MKSERVRKTWLAGSALALALALPGLPASLHAAEIQGVRFEDSLRIDAATLTLNGTGLRAVAFIKGYAAGLYVPQKSADTDVLLRQTGPRRIALRMLRKAGARDFIDAFDNGLRRNLTEAELTALAARKDAFDRNLTEIGQVEKGDVIDIDFRADGATHLTVNGVARGQAVPGADFYAALLRIFIGERPVDQGLKKGLLGLAS